MKILVILLGFHFHLNYLFAKDDICKYKLLDYFKKSDINYELIDNIDSLANKNENMLMDSIFYPIVGKYSIYRFILIMDNPISENPNIKFEKNIIILKVKNRKIIDGFQYNLNWAEPPLSCKIYRVNKKVELKNKINLKCLNFRRAIHKYENEYGTCETIPVNLNQLGYLEFNIYK